MLSLVYTALLYLFAPLALAATALRGWRDPAYRDRLGERLGCTRARFAAPCVWVHAVSVGEVQAAAVLVRALQTRYPQRPLLVTTATPTGAQRVRALFGDSVQHVYLPYDLPGAVRRFLDRTRPAIAIVMEREIWPNLFRACSRRGVPILLASARISARSARRHARLGALFRRALAGDVTVAAQTGADAERFCRIGMDPARVHVSGNVKFDLQVPAEVRAAGAALRLAHFPDRPVWVAGSTHQTEEDILLDAHELARASLPNLLLILVPRHPSRFSEVRTWLERRRAAYVSRARALSGPALRAGPAPRERVVQGAVGSGPAAQADAPPTPAPAALAPETSVLLVDTLGELLMFYAAGDLAFVGGSLVPVGGHNLLEPAALGLPILAGPHNFNAAEIATLLMEQGAALQVDSAPALARELVRLIADPAKRRAMGQRAQAIVQENRGALERVMSRVDELLRARPAQRAP